ncbi:FKBP-type peptidyl-prolyl cis-trans isomerase [Microbacterium sp. SS28]|uniref:FKBP-type peptidyl-prolyl cis-trans isomerase n=1 Tax=Microbacterium sp. SS28 TaxID=2919948 RepID=UPI001FAAB71F|nr:hypothetical protein [Microbacterium sp. SS28]
MRKIPAALAVLGLAAVGLAGCALPAGYDDCSRTASDGTATDLVTVSGESGATPDIAVPTPFHVESASFADLAQGEGPTISGGAQALVLDMQIVSGETGDIVYQSPYDGDLSRVTSFDQWVQAVPAFESALACATEGSRTVVALAPGDIEAEAAASLGLAEDESAVAVVDIQKVFLPHAQGSLVYNDARGLPTVVRAPDGRPGILVPDADAPEEVAAQTLIKGTGEVVTGDQPIRVHYTEVSWDSSSVTNSTWDGAPATETLDHLVPGAAKVLEDVTVGSQLLVVLPAKDGETGSARVFVIDILGVDQSPTQ